MRKLLLLFLLSTYSFLMFSQSKTLLNEDFELGVMPPEGWRTVTNDTWNYWKIDYDGAGSSSFCAAIPYGNYTIDNWLITPQLMPSAANHQLTFWVFSDYPYLGTTLNIQVSTGTNAVASFDPIALDTLISAMAETDTSDFTNVWTQHTVDLSAYNDEAIYIGFHSLGGGCKIKLDDIAGIPFPDFDNDLKVNALNIDSDIYFEKDEVLLNAVVTNLGSLSQMSSTISFEVDGAEFASGLLSLEPGDTNTITKTWTATLGYHEFTATVPVDENNVNDSAFGAITVYPNGALVESFEGDVFPPQNWTNPKGEWEKNDWNYFHGNNCAIAYDGSNKLVTPKLNIENNDSLSFYATCNGNDFIVLTSSNFITWDTVSYFNGTSEWQHYKVYFNDEVNSESIGPRYIAFQTIDNNFIELDLVVGPKPVAVTDDFEMISFNKFGSDVPKAGTLVEFEVVVKNTKPTSAEKTVYLMNNSDTLSSALSSVIGENETDTLIISWTPEKGYPSIELNATLAADDNDGNNSLSLKSYFYPAEPFEANMFNDFDSSEYLPDYWVSIEKGWAHWEIASPFWEGGSLWSPSCYPYSGNSVLALKNEDSADGINLITPNLAFPYSEYKVSFYLYRDDSEWNLEEGDSIIVRYNNKPDTTGSIIAGSVARSIALNPVVDTAGWYYYEFYLDCSELTEGFIIFEGVSEFSFQNTYIDNLEIKEYPPNDAEITHIIKSDAVVWGNPYAYDDVNVTLKNSGVNTLTSATINWSVDGVTQAEYAWEGNLATDSIAQVNIAEDFSFATDDTLDIKVWVTIPEDGNANNDTAESIVITKLAYELAYENSFEADTLVFENWLQIDADGDSKGWGLSTGNPNTGSQHLSSASYDSVNSVALTPDNWLVTPGFIIKHNKFYVSFYVGTEDESYFEESFDVLISTEGTDTSKFVSVHSETLTNNAYKQVVLELNDYQEKTIHLALRHHNSSNNFYLNIDDLSLYYPTIYTVNLTANPVDAGLLEGAGEFIEGEAVSISAVANDGYAFVNWTEGDVEIADTANYEFTTITANRELVANFNHITYTITATAGENGTITPAGDVVVYYDSTQSFTIEPATGYDIADVLVDGASVGAVSSYDFDTVKANHTIEASFIEITYTITATAGENGTITPAGDVVVYYDSTQSFTIEPATGYGIADVLVDGASVGAVASYDFDTVKANHTIEASFVELAYEVTFTVLNNSNTPVESATIAIEGQDNSFTTNSEGVSIVELLNGTYNYTVNATGYKEASNTFVVDGSIKDVSVTLDSDVAVNDIKGECSIYPNPFNGVIKVSNSTIIESITIIDSRGIVCKEQQVNGLTGTLNVNLNPGIYYIIISDLEGNRTTQKIIKK